LDSASVEKPVEKPVEVAVGLPPQAS
jgi:hypothetical protein